MTRYSAPPDTFEALVAPFPAGVRETAGRLRAAIRAIAPHAAETVYGGLQMGNVLYSLGGETHVFCGLQPTETHCKLYLHHVRPGDVPGLRVEGTGRNARHVKVPDRPAAEAPAIEEALRRAYAGTVAWGT